MSESSSLNMLTLNSLRGAVEKGAGVRCRRRLQPAGGPGDKLFPPTYEGGKYAMEERIVDGAKVPCVILDSVQSQANRMELALLAAARSGHISLPIVEVDFNLAEPPLREVGIITSLEAPHRIADAILRDSVEKAENARFPQSKYGKLVIDSTARNATGIFGICPTALLFGMWWNPTGGPGNKGTLGTRIQRSVTGEIVGVQAVVGKNTGGQSNPLNIVVSKETILYKTTTGDTFTLEAQLADKDTKGKPVVVGKEGKPSEVNLGSVTPDFAFAKDNRNVIQRNEDGSLRIKGGVTVDYALQTIVLSPPALRRLHFPVGAADSAKQTEADVAARTVLAALGLCAAALSIEQGCDLRSRCLLVPEAGQSAWEIIWGDGSHTAFALSAETACHLLNEAVETAIACGLSWRKEPLKLVPSKGLAELVHRSRKLAMQATEEGE